MQAVRSTAARLHRLTVEEYHRKAEAGVLAPDARVSHGLVPIAALPDVTIDLGGVLV